MSLRYLLALALLLPLSCATLPPTRAELFFPSINLVISGKGKSWCSAWSINEVGRWVTAAHCAKDGADLVMDGMKVTIRKRFPEHDLVVLNGPSAPALPLSRRSPKAGDEVYVLGYNPTPWLIPFFERIQRLDVPNSGPIWDRNMVISGSPGGGTSGSPILNTHGEVVSMVQGGFHVPPVSLGVTYDVMWEVLRVYTPTPGTRAETTGEDCSFRWLPFTDRCDDSVTGRADVDK
jgi:hypothetical protein